MKETQQSINEWVEFTFGPVATYLRIATRANQEMSELLHALSAHDYEKAEGEIADILIVLCRLSGRCGLNLLAEIEYFHALGNPLESAANANKQLASLIVFLSVSTAPPDPERIIDIASALVRTASQCGFNALTAVDTKMTINRSRTWMLDGTGCGRHT